MRYLTASCSIDEFLGLPPDSGLIGGRTHPFSILPAHGAAERSQREDQPRLTDPSILGVHAHFYPLI